MYTAKFHGDVKHEQDQVDQVAKYGNIKTMSSGLQAPMFPFGSNLFVGRSPGLFVAGLSHLEDPVCEMTREMKLGSFEDFAELNMMKMGM